MAKDGIEVVQVRAFVVITGDKAFIDATAERPGDVYISDGHCSGLCDERDIAPWLFREWARPEAQTTKEITD